MARATQTVIQLRAGALVEEDLSVRRVSGNEALSQTYSFEIEFHRTDDEPLTLTDLRGADALLSMRRPEGPERYVHGILWSAEMVEVVQGKPRYRARLVPKLERLRHVRRSRVFQHLSVPDVVKKVLDEGGIQHRGALAGSYAAREYCVQYRESDLAFVSRLLEDEGIFYWFEHSTGGHVMVLADAASGCTELPAEATFRVPEPYRKWGPIVEKAAAKYDLPPAFICAVISRETRGLNVVGDSGHGVGLMQIDDRHHQQWLRTHDAMNPEVNIDYGSSLLRRSLDSAYRRGLSGRAALKYAAALYNASEDSVVMGEAHGDVDRYTTGVDYGADVLRRMKQFERGSGDAAEDEHVFRLDLVHRVRAGSVALKDFDFERPALVLAATARAGSENLGLEHYEYPGGFRDPGEAAPVSKLRLEELRFGAENFKGEGTFLGFAPGAIITVTDHPDPGFNRKLLLVRVEHDASQQEGPNAPEGSDQGYGNTFLALDAKVPYRPRRHTSWPVACAETATVVGPGGEEIHPDPNDSVKVQFHWDREGHRNESSSCWIRVAQAWAGAGWGSSFLPRIGQEVLVRFLDGDPDRPLVMGAIYNGANPTPIALPGDKTKSTLRTDSSPGSGGANELRFEDAKDSEEIYLHAQKDKSIQVLHDKQQRVVSNEALQVKNDRDREIQANQQLRVMKADHAVVDGKQALTVQGDRGTTAGGDHSESVDVRQSITVGADQTVSVGHAATTHLSAAATLNVGGDLSVKVGKSLGWAVSAAFAGKVGGDRVEKVDASRGETVEESLTLDVGADFQTQVKGQASLVTEADHQEDVGAKARLEVTDVVGWMAKSFELKADKLSVEVGGTVAFAIDGSGKVTFDSSALTADGSTIKLKGAQVKKTS